MDWEKRKKNAEIIQSLRMIFQPRKIGSISKLLHCAMHLNSQSVGGGAIGPSRIQKAISVEPNVGLTSNQAVNLSFPLSRGLYKKIDQIMDLEGTMKGLYLVRVP